MYVDYIKERCKAKKLTVKELAELTNTSESTISNYFSRKTESPSFEVVSKLCIALDISIDEMVGIKQPEKKESPEAPKEYFENIVNTYKERITDLKSDKANLNKIIFCLCGVVVCLVIVEFFHGVFA
ncbi:MAG: helix-turn-helix transcriptional regulator [Clostridia bacterium]|nr:helix-turn-helix transcriptional regulator [Clostridia bacterium]